MLSADASGYEAVHRQVAALESNANFVGATKLAVGSPGTELALANRLNTDLEQQIVAAQRRFGAAAATATSATDGLPLAVPLLTAVLALLTLLALAQRIGEYR